LLCVKLPNKTHVTLQVSFFFFFFQPRFLEWERFNNFFFFLKKKKKVTADTALEDVMAQVTKKKGFLLQQEQSPEKYSFEIPGIN